MASGQTLWIAPSSFEYSQFYKSCIHRTKKLDSKASASVTPSPGLAMAQVRPTPANLWRNERSARRADPTWAASERCAAAQNARYPIDHRAA